MATDRPTTSQNDAEEAQLSKLVSAVESSRSSSTPEAHEGFLASELRLSVSAGSVQRTSYLLQVEHASVRHLRTATVATAPSVDLLNLLVEHGYDPDATEPENTSDRGRRLIDWEPVLRNDAVVRWLVARGVSLSHGQEEFRVVPMPAPLLETAAQWSSLSTFRLLTESGAKLGRRTLHSAVLFAGAIKADPSVPPTADFLGFDPSKKWGVDRRRMSEMLPFLVDELGLDVNAMDTERKDGPPGFWGTPLCYAVHQNGLAVVKWLLSKGADPRINNAESVARSLGHEKCAGVFDEWEKSRAGDVSQ